jgi:hypothetical protein
MKVRLMVFLAGVAVGVGIMAFVPKSFFSRPLHAQSAQTVMAIPKAWGGVKSATGSDVILEDAIGTIRFYSIRTGTLDATITRQ